MSTETVFGSHSVAIEPGPVVFIRFRGQVTLRDVQDLARITDAHCQGRRFFAINDIQQSTGMDADARKYQIKWIEGHDLGGVAVIGANLLTRGLALLLHNAHRLVSNAAVPLTFHKTEEAARAWIGQQMHDQSAPPSR